VGDSGARAAGAPVGGVLPRSGEPGDDGGVAAPDDQAVPGRELADHVRGHHVVPDPPVLVLAGAAEADPLGERGLPAQLAGHLQRGGVGDAGQPHLDPAGVQDDLGTVAAPPGAQLRLPVRHGDELDALPAGVREPSGERHRAGLHDLVQRQQQRRVQPPARHRLPGLGGGVVDLAGHGGEQRRDG
jgi:hypothetical protein